MRTGGGIFIQYPLTLITNVSSGSPGSSTATITWTTSIATVPSLDFVSYGQTSGWPGDAVPKDGSGSTPTTSHSVTLTGLSASTAYTFTVSSTSAGGTSTSSTFTFSTGASAGVTMTANLPLGGGGFSSGLSVAADGTIFLKTDSCGVYLGSNIAGTVWTQLSTPGTMPSVYSNSPSFTSGAVMTYVHRSNSSLMYMLYNPVSANNNNTWPLCQLLKSTNKGVSWTVTGYPAQVMQNNENPYRPNGQGIAVDPNNTNIVWATTTSGLQVSTNGGTTFNSVTGLPSAAVFGLAYDTTSGTTGGSTNRLLCLSNGNGIYVTTTAYNGASSTWSQISGSTTTGAFGKIASDGNYYCADGSYQLYRLSTSNTLTTIGVSGNFQSFCIDPNNPARIIGNNEEGSLSIPSSAVNTGTPSWTKQPSGASYTCSDAPWLNTKMNTAQDTSLGDQEFDPFTDSSTSSLTVASSGTLNLTVSSGNSSYYTSGRIIRVFLTGTPTTYMLGTVASYNNSSGALSLTLGTTNGGYLGGPSGGSGSHSTWTICAERIYETGGFGVYWVDGFTTGTSPAYVSQTAGIENFDGLDVTWPWTSSQGAGYPILTVNDAVALAVTSQPVGTTTGTSLTTLPFVTTGGVTEGASSDFSKADKTFVGISSFNTPSVYISTTGGTTTSGFSSTSANPAGGGGGQFRAASSTNFLVAGNGTACYQTTNGGTSWTQVSSPLPASGWGAQFEPGYNITCDTVDGTYIAYSYNGSSGDIYNWTVPGSVTKYSAVAQGSSGAVKIWSVPGNQGHVLLCLGWQGQVGSTQTIAGWVSATSSPVAGTYFYFSSNHGQSWTLIPNILEVYTFCTTAAASGQTYPTIRFWGFGKVSGSYQYGLFRIDGFNPSNISATVVTYEGVTNPKGWYALPFGMAGDMGQWGRSVTALGGGGFSIEYITGQPNNWP